MSEKVSVFLVSGKICSKNYSLTHLAIVTNISAGTIGLAM